MFPSSHLFQLNGETFILAAQNFSFYQSNDPQLFSVLEFRVLQSSRHHISIHYVSSSPLLPPPQLNRIQQPKYTLRRYVKLISTVFHKILFAANISFCLGCVRAFIPNVKGKIIAIRHTTLQKFKVFPCIAKGKTTIRTSHPYDISKNTFSQDIFGMSKVKASRREQYFTSVPIFFQTLLCAHPRTLL